MSSVSDLENKYNSSDESSYDAPLKDESKNNKYDSLFYTNSHKPIGSVTSNYSRESKKYLADLNSCFNINEYSESECESNTSVWSNLRGFYSSLTFMSLVYLVKNIAFNLVIVTLYITFYYMMEPWTHKPYIIIVSENILLFVGHLNSIVLNFWAVYKANNHIILVNVIFLSFMAIFELRTAAFYLKIRDQGYLDLVNSMDFLTAEQYSDRKNAVLKLYSRNSAFNIALIVLIIISLAIEITMYVLFVGKWNTFSLQKKTENLKTVDLQQRELIDVKKALDAGMAIIVPIFYTEYLVVFVNEPLYYFAAFAIFVYEVRFVLRICKVSPFFGISIDILDMFLTNFNFFVMIQCFSRLSNVSRYGNTLYYNSIICVFAFLYPIISNLIFVALWKSKPDTLFEERDISMIEQKIGKDLKLFYGIIIGSASLFNLAYALVYSTLKINYHAFMVCVLNLVSSPVLIASLLSKQIEFTYKYWAAICISLVQFCVLICNYSLLSIYLNTISVLASQIAEIIGVIIYTIIFSYLLLVTSDLMKHEAYLHNLNSDESTSGTSGDQLCVPKKLLGIISAISHLRIYFVLLFITTFINYKIDDYKYKECGVPQAVFYTIMIYSFFSVYLGNFHMIKKFPLLTATILLFCSFVVLIFMLYFTSRLAMVVNYIPFQGVKNLELRFQIAIAALSSFFTLCEVVAAFLIISTIMKTTFFSAKYESNQSITLQKSR